MATVHGSDITIGGERKVVELIKMMSRKYEIKKQVIGQDADLEKSGKNSESRHQVGSRRHHDRGGSERRQEDVEGS